MKLVPTYFVPTTENRRKGDWKMSAKSIIFNRSIAVRLQNRKHPQRYKYEEEEPDSNEGNQRVLGPPEQQFPEKKAAA